MAEVPYSSRLFLQPKYHPTVPPTVPWVRLLQCPRLFLLGDLAVCRVGVRFPFSATWGSGQSPSGKLLEWRAWRLFCSLAWKSLSHLFYTLGHVFAAHERSFGTPHRAGAYVSSALWFPSFGCALSEPGVTITHTPGSHSANITCYWNFYWFFFKKIVYILSS